MSHAANVLDSFNSALTRMKKSQQIIPTAHPVKVNIGSYLIVEQGWINVEGTIHAFLARSPAIFAKWMYRVSRIHELFESDAQYINVLKSHVFVHHDLKYGLPFPDNSVDFIYMSHVLEHFYVDRASVLLREAYRVLRPGCGRIRVCVPDLRHAIDLYTEGHKEEALGYFFQDSKSTRFHRHRYMYDYEMLRSALEKAGFSLVERCSYRRGCVPDIEKLDNRPEETLYVEAIK